MSNEAGLRRLRWRCRRGMRELDQLLLRWLEREWDGADATARAAFERLLDVEDDRLWRWCTGKEAIGEKELRGLVEHVLALPH